MTIFGVSFLHDMALLGGGGGGEKMDVPYLILIRKIWMSQSLFCRRQHIQSEMKYPIYLYEGPLFVGGGGGGGGHDHIFYY